MRVASTFAGALSALVAGAASAGAATLFYDGTNANIAANGNGASGGTAGTWNTTILNWDQGNALAHVAWSNSFADTAVFGGTGAAVTVGAVQVGTMNVTANTYTFNTGSIDFGSGGTGVINFNNTNSAVINATLSGAVKIQATGGTGNIGTATSVTINGNNTGLTSFELALNQDANTIVINHAAALGGNGASVKLTKGVVNLGNNAVPNNNVPITYNAWNTDLAGGTIRARFNLSTWTGPTSLSANSGLMTRPAAGVGLVFDPAATINLGTSTLTFDVDSVSAGITVNSVLSGAGNIKTDTLGLAGSGNGQGITTLSAANTFSGTATTAQNRGTLVLANVNALQNATLDTGAGAGSQTVTFAVPGTNTYNLGALAGSDGLEFGGNTISVGSKAVDTVFSGDLSGAGGSVTKVGAGTLTLSTGASYSGATSVTNGTLALIGTGAVNGSSGIAVNGPSAKLNASGSSPVVPVVTLTQGTVTGSGTIDFVDVGAGTGGIISNNNGAPGSALTIGTLNLAGGAAINLFSNSLAAPLVVGTLTNNSAANAVTITANNPGGWTNGATYSLINFTSLAGSGGNNFAHVVNNLSGRQTASWGQTGSAITISITGDNPVWTGATGDKWKTGVTNWKLVTAGTPTTFLTTDDVLFNETATGPTTIDIDVADVSPNTTTFASNGPAAPNYTLGSSGGFGIATGSLTKSGDRSLTINNANSYTAGTTLNAGTLNVNHASALGAASSLLTINGGTLDTTAGPLTTNNYPLALNGDFAFGGTNALDLGTGAATLGGAPGSIRAITVNASTLTLGGAIADGTTAVSLRKAGAGALVLGGANTISGGVTLDAGTLVVNHNSALGLASGVLTINGGALDNTSPAPVTTNSLALEIGGDFSFVGTNALSLGSGAATLGLAAGTSRTITVNASTLSIGGGIFNGATADSIVKEGAGTLRLSGSSSFTGLLSISNGTVIAQSGASLGSDLGATIVAAGATLDVGGTLGANALNLGAEVVSVSGTGVGGNGAIVNNGSNDQINALGRIVLTGDTTFGGTKRWDLRSAGPTLDMGGFNIRKVGTNQVSLVGAFVTNPGNITIDGGSFGVETTTDLGGSVANNIVVNSAGTLLFFGNALPIPWTVNLNNGAITQNSGSTTVVAPVILAAGANTINVAGASLFLNDVVTGLGGFTKTGVGAVSLNGLNDYAGLTTVNAGKVLVGHSEGLGSPAAGTIVAANAALQITNGVATNPGETVTINGGGSDFFGALQGGPGGGTWQGNVVLGSVGSRLGATGGNTLTVTGAIVDGGGNDLTISAQFGTGVVFLNPTVANTYTGPTNIVRGTLRIGKTDALPIGTVLDLDLAGGVADPSTFDLVGYNQEVAGLRDTATTNVTSLVANTGDVQSTLTLNEVADFTYDGAISGDIRVIKKGLGTQTLNGFLAFTVLDQNEGRTNLNNSLANATINANGGRLDLNADANNSTVTVADTAFAYATVSQTLASLTIADGGTFVLTNPAPPAPAELGDALGAVAVQGVPEPGTAGLLLGGMLALLGVRRRGA